MAFEKIIWYITLTWVLASSKVHYFWQGAYLSLQALAMATWHFAGSKFITSFAWVPSHTQTLTHQQSKPRTKIHADLTKLRFSCQFQTSLLIIMKDFGIVSSTVNI
jgi:hypothetical protein